MYLENVVVDAKDPQTLGRFWEATLGTETLTDGDDGYETRYAVPGGPVLDLCFQPVPEGAVAPQRLHLELGGGDGRAPGDALTDPEGHRFGVREGRAEDAGSLAALVLEVADPARAQEFWAWLGGWVPVESDGRHLLRHPSLRGPVLELRAEQEPKGAGKSPWHLDVRLEPGDDADAVAEGIAARGGRELQMGWGDLPWRHFADPSGNELCVLRAPAPQG